VIRGCRKLSTKPWLFSSPRRRERECAETVSALAGASFHERMAASPLTEAGLPELIATDAAGYVALAAGLAQNPQAPRRAACDEAGFTAALEASYRQVWRPLLRRLG
jgi:protein O-GlcNAc transferase